MLKRRFSLSQTPNGRFDADKALRSPALVRLAPIGRLLLGGNEPV